MALSDEQRLQMIGQVRTWSLAMVEETMTAQAVSASEAWEVVRAALTDAIDEVAVRVAQHESLGLPLVDDEADPDPG